MRNIDHSLERLYAGKPVGNVNNLLCGSEDEVDESIARVQALLERRAAKHRQRQEEEACTL